MFESSKVNEPLVFKSSRFYCIGIFCGSLLSGDIGQMSGPAKVPSGGQY